MPRSGLRIFSRVKWRGVLRRHLDWLAAGLAIVALAVFFVVRAGPVEPDRPASAEALIRHFERVVFRIDWIPEGETDLYYDRFRRWSFPLRIRFENVPEPLIAHIDSYLPEIEKLIGYRIWVPAPDSMTPPSISIRHVSAEKAFAFWDRFVTVAHQKESRLRELWLELHPKGVRSYACTSDRRPYSHRWPDHPSQIIIRSDLSLRKRRHCIMEEVLQSLGLIGDRLVPFESYFVEVSPPRTDFPVNDKILLRTLYDKRLKVDMNREETMAHVSYIIPELLAAYEAGGVEALYQPLRDPGW